MASGEINGTGFWFIDTAISDQPIIEKGFLLECHRKELIGEEPSKSIIEAINMNLENLLIDLEKEGYKLEEPPRGISFSLPLSVLEDIYDFWLNLFKEKSDWETCMVLLKIKKRCPLSNLIMNDGIQGNAKYWAPKIDYLHQYRPVSNLKKIKKEPMWQ